MLKKKYRLRKDSDYKLIYKKGKRIRGDFGMLLLVSADPSSDPKIGFVVGKKIGNAVRRHQHSRRLREITRIFLLNNPDSLKGMKISYIAHKYTDSYKELEKELNNQLDQAANTK